jgi:hypothetical protein
MTATPTHPGIPRCTLRRPLAYMLLGVLLCVALIALGVSARAGGPHYFRCGKLSLMIQSITGQNRYMIDIGGITNERSVTFRPGTARRDPDINGKRCVPDEEMQDWWEKKRDKSE